MEKTLIIAHRGSSSTAPENSLISIQQAVIAKADLIEIDIHLNKENDFLVIHDDLVQEQLIINKTETEHLNHNIEQNEKFSGAYKEIHPPTFEEALENTLIGSTPLIEYKRNANNPDQSAQKSAQILVATLARRGWSNKVVVQSFDVQFLAYCRSLNPEIILGWLIMDELIVHLETIEQEINPEIVAWKRIQLTKENIEWIRTRSDAQIWSWYGGDDKANDPAFSLRMIHLGINGLITDYPAQARVVKDWYNKQEQ